MGSKRSSQDDGTTCSRRPGSVKGLSVAVAAKPAISAISSAVRPRSASARPMSAVSRGRSGASSSLASYRFEPDWYHGH